MCLHPLPPRATKVEEHLRNWHGVSVIAAARMLIVRGCSSHILHWGYEENTPAKILASDKFEKILARNVGPFRFWGGPPGCRRLYTGTLLTFLIDRVLYNDAISGC
jgi:hypothetical protein